MAKFSRVPTREPNTDLPDGREDKDKLPRRRIRLNDRFLVYPFRLLLDLDTELLGISLSNPLQLQENEVNCNGVS